LSEFAEWFLVDVKTLRQDLAAFRRLGYQGLTRYCRLAPEQSLDIPGVVEVSTLQLGPLAQYLAT
jgi:hypothetical protein